MTEVERALTCNGGFSLRSGTRRLKPPLQAKARSTSEGSNA